MHASENSAAEGRDEYAIMFLSIEMCCNLLKKNGNTRTSTHNSPQISDQCDGSWSSVSGPAMIVAGIRYRFRVIVNLVVGLGVGHDGGAGIQGGGGGDDHTGDTGVDGFEGVLEFRDHSLGDGAVGDHRGEIGTGYGRNHA